VNDDAIDNDKDQSPLLHATVRWLVDCCPTGRDILAISDYGGDWQVSADRTTPGIARGGSH